jgi:uncharacterized protein YgiM (DUF1202 family)
MLRRILVTFAFLGAFVLTTFATAPTTSALSCGPCPGATTDALNLRAAPNLNAEILLVIPAGAEITYDTTVEPENGYYAVSYAGVDGYAHGLYILFFPAFATPTDWLNLRSGPSLSSSVIEVMPPGSNLDVLSLGENGFYSVRFEQRVIGYASADYIAFTRGAGFANGDDVVVNTDALNMRTSGGLTNSVMAVLYSGHQLAITGGPVESDGYTWYRVDAGSSGSGWVAGEYLSYA